MFRLTEHKAFSVFAGICFLFISNGSALLLADYLGVHRPLVNVDYFLALVPLSFGYLVFSFILMILFVVADVLNILGQVFVFIRPKDLISLMFYFPYAADAYKNMVAVFFFGVIALTALVIYLGRISSQAFTLISFNLCIFMLAYQEFTYDSSSNYYKVDKGLVLSSQTSLLVHQRLSLFTSQVAGESKPLLGFSGERSVLASGWNGVSTQRSNKLMLVLNESWGKLLNDEVERYLIGLLVQGRHSLLEKGEVQFTGVTVAAELKELCGLIPDSLALVGELPELEQCLPTNLLLEGYATRAVHGAISHMYDRRNWYPQAGFQQVAFQEELIFLGGRQCYSFPGVCDVDILRYIEGFFKDNNKGFLYWLTLNTHALYDSRDILEDFFDCRAFEINDEEVCRYLKLQAQFFHALGKSISEGSFDGVDVLIVGDHEPRLTSQSLFDEYFQQGVVPWVRIKPGS